MPHRIINLLLFCFLAKNANAFDIATIEILDEVDSSPKMTPMGSQKTISQADIKKSGVRTVAEILKQQSEMQVHDDYGDGSRVTVSLRGFGDNAGQNVLILLNGKRINNPLDISGVNFNQFNIERIEKIEIFSGSQGVVFGENAVGGVINIVTTTNEDNHFASSIKAGSYDYLQETIDTSYFLSKNISFNVNGKHTATNNYRDHNSMENRLIHANLNWQTDHQKFSIGAKRSVEELELPGALFKNELHANRRQAKNSLDFINTTYDQFNADYQLKFSPNWQLISSIISQHDVADGILSIGNFYTSIDQNRRHTNFLLEMMGNVESSLPIGIRSGVEANHAHYNFSSSFGDQDGTQTSFSIFSLLGIALTEKLQLSLGARNASISTQFADSFSFPNGKRFHDNNWLLETTIQYQATSKLAFYARFAENYRYPRLDEQVSQIFGKTTALKTQTGKSYELGATIDFEKFSAQINCYQLDLENEIAYDGALYANRNLDPTTRRGAIISGKYQFNNNISIQMGHTFTDAYFKHGVNSGNDIPVVARHHTTLGLNWQIHPQWHWEINGQMLSSRYASADDENALDKLASFGVMNSTVSFQYKAFNAGISIRNIFNKKYNEYGVKTYTQFPETATAYYPAPERNFFLTLSIDL